MISARTRADPRMDDRLQPRTRLRIVEDHPAERRPVERAVRSARSRPNAATTSASPSVPGATTSRASASASMITAPSSASRAETALLPAPMPPVRPTIIGAIPVPVAWPPRSRTQAARHTLLVRFAAYRANGSGAEAHGKRPARTAPNPYECGRPTPSRRSRTSPRTHRGSLRRRRRRDAPAADPRSRPAEPRHRIGRQRRGH